MHLELLLRSPAYTVHGWGDIYSSFSFAVIDNVNRSYGDLTAEAEKVDEWNWSMAEPVEIALGVAYDQGDSWIGAEGAVSWSLDNDELDVNRDPIINASLGTRFRVTEKIFAGVGVFSDQSPWKTPTDFAVEDVDYYGATAGLRLTTPLTVTSGAEPGGLVFSTTVACRYTLGFGKAGGMFYDVTTEEDQEAISFPTRDVVYHEIALHIGTGLMF